MELPSPADQPQSFTCPYCGKMGFTESALQEHVASEHSDASIEVVSIQHLKYFRNPYYVLSSYTGDQGTCERHALIASRQI